MEKEDRPSFNLKVKYAALNIPKNYRMYEYAIRAINVNCYKLIHGRINLDGQKEIIYLYKFEHKRKIYELMKILPYYDWWNFKIDSSLYQKLKKMIYNNGGSVRYNKFIIELRWENSSTKSDKCKFNYNEEEYEEFLSLRLKQVLKNEILQKVD